MSTQLDRIESMLTRLLTIAAGAPPSFDPEARFIPKEWPDQTCKGKKFSQLEPALLDMLTNSYEHFSQKSRAENKLTSTGKSAADWELKLSETAKRWAAYKRATAKTETTGEPELPF